MPAMATTTATTCFCLFSSGFSTIPAVSAFGIFAGLVVLFDFVLVATWLPACTLIYSRTFEERCGHKLCGCCAVPCCRKDTAEPGQPLPERGSVSILRNRVMPFIIRYRFALLVGSLVVTVAVAAGGLASARIAEGFPSGLPDYHPVQAVTTIQREDFGVIDDWRHQVTFVYGIDNETAVTYAGTTQIFPPFGDEKFLVDAYERFTPEVQEGIVAQCRQISKNKELVHANQRYCILNDLARARAGSFPFRTERELRKALEEFYEGTEYAARVDEASDYTINTGFMADPNGTGILALWHTVNTTIPQTVNNGPLQLQPYYERWEEETKRCAMNCFQMLPVVDTLDASRAAWSNWDFLRELVRVTLNTVVYSIVLAFLVLLVATRNWILSLMVIFAILCIIICVLASVFLSGFEVGVRFAACTWRWHAPGRVRLTPRLAHALAPFSSAGVREHLHSMGAWSRAWECALPSHPRTPALGRQVLTIGSSLLSAVSCRPRKAELKRPAHRSPPSPPPPFPDLLLLPPFPLIPRRRAPCCPGLAIDYSVHVR